MKQIDNVLTPDEGYMLTQAAETDIENRIVTSQVILAVNDSPSNWREIPKAEAEAILAQQEARLQQAVNEQY